MPSDAAARLLRLRVQATSLQDAIEKHFRALVELLHERPSAQVLTTAAVNSTTQVGCNLGHLALLVTAVEHLGEPDHPVVAEYYERLKMLEGFYETATRVERSGAVPYFGNYVVSAAGLRSLGALGGSRGGSSSRRRRRSPTQFTQARSRQLDAEAVLGDAMAKLRALEQLLLRASRQPSYATEPLLTTLYTSATACLARTVTEQVMADHPVLRARLEPQLEALDADYGPVIGLWRDLLLSPGPRTRHATPRPWPPR